MDTESLKIKNKIKNAKQLLGLTQNKKHTFSEIKKHYRIAALKTTPTNTSTRMNQLLNSKKSMKRMWC